VRLPDGGGHASGDNVVISFLLLQHEPHALHVVASVAPVTLGIDVSEVQAVLSRAGQLSTTLFISHSESICPGLSNLCDQQRPTGRCAPSFLPTTLTFGLFATRK
jgi:hypothetical protein